MFGPSPSSSIPSLSVSAFNAGCCCQCSCHCLHCCHYHCCRCHHPCCCCCAGVCVAPPSRPFVAPAGCCLLLCLCCWHLCRVSLFWLIVAFVVHCCGGAADDNVKLPESKQSETSLGKGINVRRI